MNQTQLPVDRPAIGAPPSFTPPAPESLTLSCGLPVWLLRRSDLPLLSLRLGVAGGSMDDLPGRAGLSSLTDSVLVRGAGDRDALAFAELTERLALAFSISTTTRATTLGFDTHRLRVETALDLLADVVLRPRLEDAEIERARALRMGELLAAQDEPDEIARAVVQRALYGDAHPAAHLPRGRRAEVSAITPEEIRASWARRRDPRSARLVVCGDFEPDALVQALERRFSAWAPGTPPAAVPPSPPRAGRALVLVDVPGATQSQLAVLAPAPGVRSPDLHGARLAIIALGGMFTSRLNRLLREQKGYTYGVQAQLLPGPEQSLLSVRTAVQGEPTADALADLVREVDRLRDGLDAEELERARLARITQLVQALESRSGVAESFASLWEAGRPPDGFQAEIPALQAETLESVTRASARVEVERAAIVVVGDLARVGAAVEQAVPGGWQRWPAEL